MTEPTSMAAAIDAGVAAASPTPAPAPEETTNVDTNENSESTSTPGSAGDTDATAQANSGGVGVDGAAPAGKDSAEAKPGAVGADGKPVPDVDAGKDTGKPGTETPEELAEKARLQAAAKKPDPLTDPLPNALKPETKERIRTLIGMTKEQTARADKAETQLSTIVTRIRETQSTPEQYGQALDYLRLVNSGNRDDLLRALEFMEGERVALARMAGVALPGVSMLAEYPDLVAEVQGGKITAARGEELAAARAANEHRQQSGQHSAQVQAQRTQHTQAVQTAQAQLNAEEAALKANDPTYMAKRPIILKIMQPLIRSGAIPPNQWLSEFRRIYADLPAPIARPAAATTVPANTPLRANQPAGGAVPAPKTMAEAMELGIAAARGA